MLGFALALAAFLAPTLAAAGEPPRKGLPPDEKQAVQAIARALLTAKHDDREEAAVVELQRRVLALRDAVVALHEEIRGIGGDQPAATSLSALEPDSAPGPHASAEGGARRKAAERRVRDALAAARQQRAEVEQHVPTGDRVGQKALAGGLARKTAELETEIESVLRGSPGDLPVRLAELRKRLEATGPPALPPVSETPGFSTTTRHRD